MREIRDMRAMPARLCMLDVDAIGRCILTDDQQFLNPVFNEFFSFAYDGMCRGGLPGARAYPE